MKSLMTFIFIDKVVVQEETARIRNLRKTMKKLKQKVGKLFIFYPKKAVYWELCKLYLVY